jgi:TonB family protein
MRMAGKPGYVKLELAVDDDGRVIEAAVLEANGRPFAREALRAVGQWRFVPADVPQPSGRRVIRVPIEFALIVPTRFAR